MGNAVLQCISSLISDVQWHYIEMPFKNPVKIIDFHRQSSVCHRVAFLTNPLKCSVPIKYAE